MVGGSSPSHSNIGVAPATRAWATKPSASSLRALTQIGHTSNAPPPSANWPNRRSSGGQPSQNVPSASPGTASRTASWVRNMPTSRPRSSAAPATRNATVTRSPSSIPVDRLISTFPGMAPSFRRSAGSVEPRVGAQCDVHRDERDALEGRRLTVPGDLPQRDRRQEDRPHINGRELKGQVVLEQERHQDEQREEEHRDLRHG